MKWQIALKQWREDRGLTEPQAEFVNMFNEEINEAKAADDIFWVLDGLCDALVVLTNEICQRGYADEKFLMELERININSNKNVIGTKSIADVQNEDFDVGTDKVDLLNMYRKIIILVMSLGYDPILCMKQVVKHISCRKQDPEQAKLWKDEPWRKGTEKWHKWKLQPQETIYQPNFEVCKYGK